MASTKKRTVTGKVSVWLSTYGGPEVFDRKEDERVIAGVAFTTTDMTDCGYTRVGTATVSFEVPTGQELIDNKAASLRAEIQKTRADAEVKVNALTERLNKLLALEYVA
jgi:hypothetical protein